MTENTQRHDLRESQRTDELRAAEKKAGETPFDGKDVRPEDPPADPLGPETKR